VETINFGSFPRSGNHFFVALANKLLVNTNIVWHQHKIFYLLKEKNSVTTIRNPIDAVHSLCFRTGEMGQDFIDNSLNWYKLYYKEINKHNVFVIPFSKLIDNPSICFDNICKKYELNENKMSSIDVSQILGKENVENTIPKSLIENILKSKILYDVSSLFNELCNQ